MFGDCGRRRPYIWKASDLTPEVISPGQLKVHVCFQQQLCKLLLPWLCRAYVKIPQRQCPLCEPRALLIPGSSNPSFKRNGPKMALPPQTDVFQPLSKAAFISSWKGKHHNLGSHVSRLSVRHCQLFLQHPRVLWQSREQVTHLSKGCVEWYHSVRSSELRALVLFLTFFLNRKYLCVYHVFFFFYCTLIFFASHCSTDLLYPVQNMYCSVRTFLMVLWHVGGPDVPWKQALSQQ